MGPRWCLAHAGALSWRAWDDEIVLYDDAAGDTHHFAPLAAEVFEHLHDRPSDLDELAERLSQSLGLALDHNLSQSVAAIIEQFFAHGLIRRMLGETHLQ